MGKKYTTTKTKIDFQVDDDVFYLKEVIPAGVLFEFSNLQSQMEEAMKMPGMSVADVILNQFEKILKPESFELFNSRFFGVTETAIDFPTFQLITEDILTEVAGKAAPSK